MLQHASLDDIYVQIYVTIVQLHELYIYVILIRKQLGELALLQLGKIPAMSAF